MDVHIHTLKYSVSRKDTHEHTQGGGYLNPAILFVLKWGQVAACFLVALNFGMGLKLGIARKMVKSKIKSPLWAKIFNTYCISFAVFWIIAAGTIAMRGS